MAKYFTRLIMEDSAPINATAFLRTPNILFGCFAALSLAAIFAAAASGQYLWLAIPFFILLICWTVVDLRGVFYLLLFCLPLSIEYELPNGFGTDLPTEPLMVGLMVAFLLFAAGKKFLPVPISSIHAAGGARRFIRPLSVFTLLLFLHWSWIALSALHAREPFIAFKFLLAKGWYIVTFYFLAGMFLRDKKDLQRMAWMIFIPLAAVTALTLARHSAYGFSFKDVKLVVVPYFRNHVSYACMLVAFFPYTWMLHGWERKGSFKRFALGAGGLLFLTGVYFSYTRAAYVALVGAAGFYFVVRWRLTAFFSGAVAVAALIWVTYIVQHNKFLEYAPNFNKTIMHRNFDQLLQATYKLEDISTMERVYRWVAGFQMVADRPVWGFGPNNFYDHYRSYTVTGFRTYVSKNPEHSGIHCYYLMSAVEQGLPGMLIFLALCFFTLIYGERLYHRAVDPDKKRWIMSALLSFFIILQLLLINDLIETDKIGSFFFMALAVLHRAERGT